jgi:hypothetical protein
MEVQLGLGKADNQGLEFSLQREAFSFFRELVTDTIAIA